MLFRSVNHIARQQAHLGGFVESPSSSLEAFADEDDDDDDEDEDASSSSDEEMMMSQWPALCHS